MEINTNHVVHVRQISKSSSIKTQIMLANTACTIEEYFVKLNKRGYGNFDAAFTFTIGKDGTVYRHYNPKYYTKQFNIPSLDAQIISIGMENIGWVKQKTSMVNLDWKGSIYKGEVFEKTWRGKNLWEPYTLEQEASLLDLLETLIKDFNIEPNFSGKSIVLDNPQEFKGVLNRSNYFKYYYDLSPAFNLDLITERINKIKTTQQ